MKTFRLIALLALAALAACADPITAPTSAAGAEPAMEDNGQGFMGGGTRG
jgi:curli biogenesis system outer membrane secretion channel CsgG